MEWSGREDELWMLPLHTFAVLMNSGLLVMCFQPSYSLNFSSLFIPSLVEQWKCWWLIDEFSGEVELNWIHFVLWIARLFFNY